MKKNNINLLVNREDYQKYENLFERLKLSATVLTVILTVIFGYFYISLRNNFNTYEKMNTDKKNYLLLLANRQGDEAKINYIQSKYDDLKNFMKDDASTVTYYKILSDALNSSSESAKLKSLEVDKSHNASFTVTFLVFEKMMDFLKFAESKTFLDNFEIITLKNLEILGNKSKDNTSNYELSFTGKFIPVKADLINEN